MLLHCVPMGICSWNFRVEGEAGAVASARLGWTTERGSIELGGTPYEVVKHGMLSGRWSLTDGEERVLVVAEKPSLFLRRFMLTHGDRTVRLQATKVVPGRSFTMVHEDRELLRIEPKHPFTRRGTIRAEDSLDLEVVVFAFWLTAMMWRRMTSGNGGGGGG